MGRYDVQCSRRRDFRAAPGGCHAVIGASRVDFGMRRRFRDGRRDCGTGEPGASAHRHSGAARHRAGRFFLCVFLLFLSNYFLFTSGRFCPRI